MTVGSGPSTAVLLEKLVYPLIVAFVVFAGARAVGYFSEQPQIASDLREERALLTDLARRVESISSNFGDALGQVKLQGSQADIITRGVLTQLDRIDAAMKDQGQRAEANGQGLRQLDVQLQKNGVALEAEIRERMMQDQAIQHDLSVLSDTTKTGFDAVRARLLALEKAQQDLQTRTASPGQRTQLDPIVPPSREGSYSAGPTPGSFLQAHLAFHPW